MDTIAILGGTRLHGTVRVAGAKNAALPILAATLLASGTHRLENVPTLADTVTLGTLLGELGARVHADGPSLTIDTGHLTGFHAPEALVRRMRASILVLGPLLARHHEARVALPGGCAIGLRPIDQHLKGLSALGCSFELDGGVVHGRTDRLRGATIRFDMPSVTATENVLMAAVLAEGRSVLQNAAREPEIVDLVCFLRGMGARIRGEGTPTLVVDGVEALRPGRPFSILPDRIEAGTWLAAAAITGGDVVVEGAGPADLAPVLERLTAAGCVVEAVPGAVRLRRSGPLRGTDVVTRPHPGFPTDMQAQVMAVMTVASGSSTVTETIFENRFMHVAELRRLGADITVEGNLATVRGVPRLVGAMVTATDLRASAGLVVAGLAAEGRTEILGLEHLDRGYERLVEKLQGLGAEVARLQRAELHADGSLRVSA